MASFVEYSFGRMRPKIGTLNMMLESQRAAEAAIFISHNPHFSTEITQQPDNHEAKIQRKTPLGGISLKLN